MTEYKKVALSPEYADLVEVLADQDLEESTKIEALIFCAMRKSSLRRGLPVARALCNAILAMTALDICVKHARNAALGKETGEDPITQDEIEVARGYCGDALNKLIEEARNARRTYENLYREPDSVDPKAENEEVMREVEAANAQRRKDRTAAILAAVTDMFGSLPGVTVKSADLSSENEERPIQ